VSVTGWFPEINYYGGTSASAGTGSVDGGTATTAGSGSIDGGKP
jgi:hypothetical protein